MTGPNEGALATWDPGGTAGGHLAKGLSSRKGLLRPTKTTWQESTSAAEQNTQSHLAASEQYQNLSEGSTAIMRNHNAPFPILYHPTPPSRSRAIFGSRSIQRVWRRPGRCRGRDSATWHCCLVVVTPRHVHPSHCTTAQRMAAAAE